jgi:hypothetical protein
LVGLLIAEQKFHPVHLTGNHVLLTTDDMSSPPSETTFPVAEWTSSVFAPPEDSFEPKACFMYNVNPNKVTRVSAKLLRQKQNEDSLSVTSSVDLFSSWLHTKDHVEIQLNGVTRYQVTIFQ